MGSSLPIGGMGGRTWRNFLCRENLLLERVASAVGSLIKGKFDVREAGMGGGSQAMPHRSWSLS